MLQLACLFGKTPTLGRKLGILSVVLPHAQRGLAIEIKISLSHPDIWNSRLNLASSKQFHLLSQFNPNTKIVAVLLIPLSAWNLSDLKFICLQKTMANIVPSLLVVRYYGYQLL